MACLPGSVGGRTRYSPQHRMNACQNALAAALAGHTEYALFWSSIIHQKDIFGQQLPGRVVARVGLYEGWKSGPSRAAFWVLRAWPLGPSSATWAEARRPMARQRGAEAPPFHGSIPPPMVDFFQGAAFGFRNQTPYKKEGSDRNHGIQQERSRSSKGVHQ